MFILTNSLVLSAVILFALYVWIVLPRREKEKEKGEVIDLDSSVRHFCVNEKITIKWGKPSELISGFIEAKERVRKGDIVYPISNGHGHEFLGSRWTREKRPVKESFVANLFPKPPQ